MLELEIAENGEQGLWLGKEIGRG